MVKEVWYDVCNRESTNDEMAMRRNTNSNSNSNASRFRYSLDFLGCDVFEIAAAGVADPHPEPETNPKHPPSELSDIVSNREIVDIMNDDFYDTEDDASVAEFHFESNLITAQMMAAVGVNNNHNNIGFGSGIRIDAEIDMDDELSLAEFHPPSVEPEPSPAKILFGSHPRNSNIISSSSSNNNNNYYNIRNTMIGTNHWRGVAPGMNGLSPW